MGRRSNFKNHQGCGKGSGPLGKEPPEELWAAIRAERTTAKATESPVDSTPPALMPPFTRSAAIIAQSARGKDAFIAQCVHAVKDHAHTDMHGEWKRIFDTILESALSWRTVAAALDAPPKEIKMKLSEALKTSVLKITLDTDYPIDGSQITSRSFMLTYEKGGRELNNRTKKAIENFVNRCLENYGELLPPPKREQTAQR